MRELELNGYIDDEVWFGDEITPESLHESLYPENADQMEEVHIRLNSYGGSCNAATRMFDDLKAYPGHVTVTISGTCASAATVFAMAANRLEMTPGSLFMIHDPSLMVMGNEKELMDAVHMLQACKDSIINVYKCRCPLEREALSDMMSAVTWLDAEKARDQGFIDAVTEQNKVKILDCALSRSEAEKKVQAWYDRQKPHSSYQGGLPAFRTTVQPEKTGIPVAQLKKRLSLIRPQD